MMTKTNKTFLKALLLFSIGLFFWLTQGYIGVMICSIITAFFASPLFNWCLKKWKKSRIALSLTWIVITLTVVIPVFFVGLITVRQADTFASDIEKIATTQIKENDIILDNATIQKFIEEIKNKAEEYHIRINVESRYQKGIVLLKNITTQFTTWVYNFTIGVFGWFTLIFLYVIITSAILLHQSQLLKGLKKLLPLEEKQTEKYLNRIGAMMTSIIKGSFVIAFIQGIITGISFAIGGVPYSMFWTLLVSFLSLIPMIGAGVIAFPVGIVLLITGSIRQGIMILLVNMVIVGNIDNILRPKLVSKTAKINGALLIMSIFGGMSLFGLMGIFYGPIIMIFIITTVEYYLETKKEE